MFFCVLQGSLSSKCWNSFPLVFFIFKFNIIARFYENNLCTLCQNTGKLGQKLFFFMVHCSLSLKISLNGEGKSPLLRKIAMQKCIFKIDFIITITVVIITVAFILFGKRSPNLVRKKVVFKNVSKLWLLRNLHSYLRIILSYLSYLCILLII